ncbi:type I DNA topoisomerase [Aeromicrobium duanguangcaii]|uniref:DNA topoisomerase 1 n=1 Tax=Aeromicrobium duanguangcaii TaxID=2968086 RepID=A0ABY5KGZ8_9ACTN|nr:type I DNA topoisomerase [Aeromicrobium duanguangcaii]MCD9154203.1 type I DNA topoisomerase [Aeromicrobium duanguangcaii]UUI68726.1 type I DNA topoisomerase [Aeromicrobium duanguangcaii]
MTSLVIVESPNKVRSIAAYLGDGYVVSSSVGHIRDLPQGADQIPAKYKGESWARLGVNIDEGFEPVYVVPADKKKQIAELKKLLKDADELVLATDEDREGEAIAWHLFDELKPKVPVKRIAFNEITKEAIQRAIANPRDIDQDLVDAQETRRILDRLYGYEISPVLWKKVMSGLSAGRVQSVATRLVVERERERMAFRSADYWDLEATFGCDLEPSRFPAKLATIDGKRVASGSNFDSTGTLKGKAVHLDESGARALATALEGREFAVRSVESKPYTRRPYAPFRTTTLQQEGSRKYGFGAQRTMSIAQKLYEGGYITYMRTDSVTLSQTALTAARAQVKELYGADYLPDKPRVYTSKVKNAQEAHEAIRPAGESFRTPRETGLSGDELKLYELIWKRTIASQMADAKGNSVSIRIGAATEDGQDVEFSATGRTITFHGFLKAYVETTEDPDAENDDKQTKLPNLSEGDSVTAVELAAAGHQTKPPARYTEASLIKELEDREIGRPSTYASIVNTIQNRGYVYKKGTALVPAWVAFSVIRLMEQHFPRLVQYEFTAELEGVLDEISHGRENRVAVLESFWSGEDEQDTGLKRLVDNLPEIDARGLATFDLGDDIAVRVGRYGPYVEGPPMVEGKDGTPTPTRANIPEDLPPDELTLEKAKELLATPAGLEKVLGDHPETGLRVVAKNGRYGPYVTEALPEDAKKGAKPRTASLFKSMDLDTITLEDAVKLLTLPRVVGTDEEGTEITAQNGRYGPYLKKGTDSRSLESEEQLLTITEEQARAIYAQPKTYGRRAAAAPLKELGEDPTSGQPIVAKNGRFGAYVTDGEYNATLRKDDDIETLTHERAVELLAERRAKGPAKKGAKKTTKKSTAKKTTAKKATTKKAAAKKTTTKKTPAKKA